MPTAKIILSVVAALTIAAGLSGACLAAPTPPSTAHSRPAGVAWFEGDVAQAFEAARRQGKPVFVYFGAVWCPPCQELKATVFRRKDFLDRLTLFVPVYLDGDAPDAQRWAEVFRIVGYPTVLILRSDRTEIERVSGGMDLGRYAEVLQTGITALRPIQQIIASLQNGGEPLSRDDCRILAYNGWELDDDWIHSDEHPGWLAHTASVLARAAGRCPSDARIERARLQITAAAALAEAEAGALKSGKTPSLQLTAAVRRVLPLLKDPVLASEAGDAWLELPSAFFVAAARLEAGSHAAELERSFSRLMDGLASDPRYSTATQLFAISEKIQASQALEPSGKEPPAMASAARQRADKELAQVHEPYARTSVVNAVLDIYDQLGDEDRSYALLLNEMKTSATPYYYMSDLGELQEKRGQNQAALEWFARAYRESQGAATRIQWGAAYVRALLRMQPDDEAAIRSAALQVIAEVHDAENIQGRSRYALESLATRLHDWNQGGRHAAAFGEIQTSLGQLCRKGARADARHDACSGILAKMVATSA